MSWRAEQHDTEWPFEYHATPFDLNPDSTALLTAIVGHWHTRSRTRFFRHQEL